jgi:hypothetical protein
VIRFLAVVAVSATILAGCAENGGFTQTRPDARPFGEAHSECWAQSMNLGGNAATGAQVSIYDACMRRNGWADQRGVM